MSHSIELVNSSLRDGSHKFMICKWNANFSMVVNFVIMTTSATERRPKAQYYKKALQLTFLLISSIMAIWYGHTTKILLNPIKILKKIDLYLDTHLDYHQPPPSLITKWRTRVAWTQLELTTSDHEFMGFNPRPGHVLLPNNYF